MVPSTNITENITYNLYRYCMKHDITKCTQKKLKAHKYLLFSIESDTATNTKKVTVSVLYRNYLK
jgi:hypothetical protein